MTKYVALFCYFQSDSIGREITAESQEEAVAQVKEAIVQETQNGANIDDVILFPSETGIKVDVDRLLEEHGLA